MPPTTASPHPLSHLRALIFTGLLAVGLATILVVPLLPPRHRIAAGEVSPYTIKSPINVVPFVSKTLTEEERSNAARAVPGVVVFDPEVAHKQLGQAAEVLDRITAIRETARLNSEQKSQALAQMSDLQLSARAADAAIDMSAAEWEKVRKETARVLFEAMKERIRTEDLVLVRARVSLYLDGSVDLRSAPVVRELVQALLRPNMTVDEVATERARREAMEKAEPVLTGIARGETILRDGQIVLPLHLEKLRASGLLDAKLIWEEIAGLTLLATILSAGLGAYVVKVRPLSLRTDRRLLLVVLVVLGTVLAAKLLLPGRPLW
ncbi:MAG: metal dependent phosphohydrolase, partial [Dehalococcoidia bacterium]|nr:metal dependent phosphohydrolase [Dehalococcoidia bacterium]